MLPITTIAPVPGPAGLPIVLGWHTFQANRGSLEHYIDGDLRAVVPPEGLKGYTEFWPQCADLVSQLTRAPAKKPATAAALPGVDAAVAALNAALAV